MGAEASPSAPPDATDPAPSCNFIAGESARLYKGFRRNKRRWSNGMVIGRALGWLLVLAALVVLARDLIGWLDTHHLVFVAAGDLWYQLSPNTILLAQPAIQRHLAPWLWDPVVEDLLLLPAVVILGAPGLALLWLCRSRDRRRRRR